MSRLTETLTADHILKALSLIAVALLASTKLIGGDAVLAFLAGAILHSDAREPLFPPRNPGNSSGPGNTLVALFLALSLGVGGCAATWQDNTLNTIATARDAVKVAEAIASNRIKLQCRDALEACVRLKDPVCPGLQACHAKRSRAARLAAGAYSAMALGTEAVKSGLQAQAGGHAAAVKDLLKELKQIVEE